jgi:hypothetical protein
MSTQTPDHAAQLQVQIERLKNLTDVESNLAFFHFLGAVGVILNPRNTTHVPIPARIIAALERAIDAKLGERKGK